MGWSFRRSVNLGPLRINLSKSGVGYSVGMRGFRVGQDARGLRYQAVSIPKTGIYRRDYQPKTPIPVPSNSMPPSRAVALRGRSTSSLPCFYTV